MRTHPFLSVVAVFWPFAGGVVFGQDFGTKSSSDVIQAWDGIVRFVPEGGASANLTLSEFESATLSDHGDRCVVYDRQTRVGRLLNLDGKSASQFLTEQPFAGLAVSNMGWAALHSPITREPTLNEEIILFGAGGQELWRVVGRFLRPMAVEFSLKGDVLAVLAETRAESKAKHVTAVLFDQNGERWSHDFGPGFEVGDIAFDPSGGRVAFGIFKRSPTGTEESQVFVRDLLRGTMQSIPIRDAGQAVVNDCLAFSEVGDVLLVNGLAKVQAYDVATRQRLWSTELNEPSDVTDLLDTAVKIAVRGDRILVAHRINAPEGRVKYAVSGVGLGSKKLFFKYVHPDPQPSLADVGRFWDVRSDGESVVIYLESGPITVQLP